MWLTFDVVLSLDQGKTKWFCQSFTYIIPALKMIKAFIWLAFSLFSPLFLRCDWCCDWQGANFLTEHNFRNDQTIPLNHVATWKAASAWWSDFLTDCWLNGRSLIYSASPQASPAQPPWIIYTDDFQKIWANGHVKLPCIDSVNWEKRLR